MKTSKIAHSIYWNFLGLAVPLVLALFSIPVLIEGMGIERFGLLSIIWMVVGYFSLFDLGFGRALTRIISERSGLGNYTNLDSIVWTALVFMGVLGIIGGLFLFCLSPLLVNDLLKLSASIHMEAIDSLRVMAVGVPMIVMSSCFLGILEAHQRFKVIASIRIPLGLMIFTGPLFTLQFSPNLVWVAVVLLASRFFALIFFLIFAARDQRELLTPRLPDRSSFLLLTSFGGWLTVTNLLGPMMTYLDRFFIGSFLGLKAVSYYVTPYELISRIQILPHAILGVLFPALSTLLAQKNQQKYGYLYSTALKTVYLTMMPIAAAAILVSPEALQLWLGDDFRIMSTAVVQWLAVGCLVNALARPALTILYATGRTDLVAKCHIGELIPYSLLLWTMASNSGIAGVAAASMLRMMMDTVLLNALVAIKIPSLRRQVVKTLLTMLSSLVLFYALSLLENLALRLCILLVLCITSGAILWLFTLKSSLRVVDIGADAKS